MNGTDGRECYALLVGENQGRLTGKKSRMAATRAGVSHNNLKENYEYIPVNYRGCVDSGWVVNCCGYSVLVTNKTPVLNVIRVGQPDYTTMHSSHIVLLPMPQFSLAIHCIHVLPAMKNRFLMSVEKLCDGGFSVNFDAKHVYLQKRA